MARGKDSGSRTAARVFRAIWRNPHISRVEIAESLDLDKSTVTNQVNHLIELGLIEEAEEGEASSKGGRRPIQLNTRKSFGCIIGIELQVESYVAVVVDLSGEILAEKRGKASINADNLGDSVIKIVEKVEADFKRGQRLLGVGIGIGGLVDSKRNKVRYSVPLRIDKPLDFGKAIAGKILVPCSIENDANCCAWGELSFNRTEEQKNFLFALVEYRSDKTSIGKHGGIGVGFGIVLGGKVYSGGHGNAGEFRSAFCQGQGELQLSLPREELARMDSDRSVLERATDELARNMAMFVNTMDFDRVYIGGDIEGLDVDLPAMLKKRLQENWMYPWPKDVEMRYSSLGGRSVAYGAAGMILERLVSERLLPGLSD